MPLGVRSKIAFAVGVALQRNGSRDLDRSAAQGQSPGRRSLLRDQDVDPQRAFEPTASIVDRGVYDTLLTFKRRRLASGADGGSRLPGNRRREDVHVRPARDIRFADGTPMTAADVVFSFRRLINLKGNPAFLLSGVTPSARGRYTVVLRSRTPNTAIPSIVANTSLGIVNSKLARRHGATDGPNAAKTDKAERWFNSPASVGAGSGPYVLRQYSTTSQIVLDQNPRYWRAKPAFERVVIRNMVSATQFINVQRGRHEVAIDLSAQQAQGLRGTAVSGCGRSRRRGCSGCSPTTTRSRPRRRTSASPPFGTRSTTVLRPARRARRDPGKGDHPLDVPRRAAGVGCREPEPHACAQRARSVGCRRADVRRVPERPHDQRRRVRHAGAACRRTSRTSGSRSSSPARLSARGWTSTAADDGVRPVAVGTGLPRPRRLPRLHAGELVGVRRLAEGRRSGTRAAGRNGASRPTTAPGADLRCDQRRLNQSGPYFPLIQPTQVFAATSDLRGAVFNPLYSIDVRLPQPAG